MNNEFKDYLKINAGTILNIFVFGNFALSFVKTTSFIGFEKVVCVLILLLILVTLLGQLN